MNAAVEAINQVVAANVKIVFGATIDDTLENQVRITVIATGVKYLGRYQRLKRLLAAGKWEEADNETANLIFQFIIEMICSGDGDIPIFLKLASGNQADSSCFGKIAVEYQKQLEVNSLLLYAGFFNAFSVFIWLHSIRRNIFLIGIRTEILSCVFYQMIVYVTIN